MKFLLTNDDGIDAPGLLAIEQALTLAQGETVDATIVAPVEGYSGCGHLVNYREALEVTSLTDRRYCVRGAPADCTRIALSKLVSNCDWVLSGINQGANLGVDVWMSGTVSAVREAGWMGVRGIAISQYFRQDLAIDWEQTARAAARVLKELLSSEEQDVFWNVNLPAVSNLSEDLPIHNTFIEPGHLPISYEQMPDGRFRYTGDYRQRPRTPGSDVDSCFGGAISVTRIPRPGHP